MVKKTVLMNAGYTNVSATELLELAMEDVKKRQKSSIVFLNVDVVMKIEKDRELARIVGQTEYVMADGMPLIWISRLFGKPLKEKVSGSDFIPLLCESAVREGKSIFLAGGAENVAETAAQKLNEKYAGIRIAGTYFPPFGFEKKTEEIRKMNAEIQKAVPDILIVCLGCPKQEKYVYENREQLGVPLSICAGAAIDFIAGNVKRCPAWMSQCGLEWFYRFLKEPRRLFKRYFLYDMQILGLVMKYWKNRAGGGDEEKDQSSDVLF